MSRNRSPEQSLSRRVIAFGDVLSGSLADHLSVGVSSVSDPFALVSADTSDTDASDAADTSAELVSITVRDNGTGLPADEWAIIPGEASITQLQHGSGLEPWLVCWVVEGYGGGLSYVPEADGTAISISLPRVAVDAAMSS